MKGVYNNYTVHVWNSSTVLKSVFNNITVWCIQLAYRLPFPFASKKTKSSNDKIPMGQNSSKDKMWQNNIKHIDNYVRYRLLECEIFYLAGSTRNLIPRCNITKFRGCNKSLCYILCKNHLKISCSIVSPWNMCVINRILLKIWDSVGRFCTEELFSHE